MRYELKLVHTAVAVAVALAFVPTANARVTKIVIDQKVSPAFCVPPAVGSPPGTSPVCPTFGSAGQYETLTGRAFGELDPQDPHNGEITDLNLANKGQKAEYIASFFIVKPIDMSRSSGLMWHDVPNRGGRVTISTDLRTQGDIGISSGW